MVPHYRYRKSHGWLGILLVLLSWGFVFAQQNGWIDETGRIIKDKQPGLYHVSQIADGDTIVVSMNGKPERVRFIGVDTPETHKPNSPVECYGPAAAIYTKNIIGKNRVRLVADPLSTNRDRYDRLLRYVYLADGTHINEKLVQNGYAFYYPYFPFTQSSLFAAHQQAAQAAHKGLWGNCNPTKTDGGGYKSNPQG